MRTSLVAEEWISKFKESSFDGEIRVQEPLKKHTYFQIGGPADLMVFPASDADLETMSEFIRKTSIPFSVIGVGSNTLASDKGFRGLVIKLNRYDLSVELVSAGLLRTGSSLANSTLLRKAVREGWGGLEFLSGVPGSVGGAVFMNAGTHLGDSAGALVRVEVFSLLKGKFFSFEGNELVYQYRKNLFLESDSIVLRAWWRVQDRDSKEVEALISSHLERRKKTQPIDYPSCGSVFKNPKNSNAWKVLDQLELRGFRIGNAQFSDKHPNFIINHGDARAEDVRKLIELAKSKAARELKIDLEEEVRYLGFLS